MKANMDMNRYEMLGFLKDFERNKNINNQEFKHFNNNNN